MMRETQYFRVKNWHEFQHYKDRQPPWIKLYTNLNYNVDFMQMSDPAKLLLISIWIMASKSRSGVVPDDFNYLKRGLFVTNAKKFHIAEIIKNGFLIPVPAGEIDHDLEHSQTDTTPISRKLRAEIMGLTGGRCAKCGSIHRLHIDHIIPRVCGGLTDFENLQPLCSNCHKDKGLNKTNYLTNSSFLLAKYYQNATLEKEVEVEVEKERENLNPPTPQVNSQNSDKEQDMASGWKSYFTDLLKPRLSKDNPDSWKKLHTLITAHTVPDTVDAFRKFLAAGYVGDYPIAEFLKAAGGILDTTGPAYQQELNGGPPGLTVPMLADELAEISKLDIVFGSAQRVALANLESQFGRPDMVLAFRTFMGNLKDEKDYKFAAKNFVEQAVSYVHVIRKGRDEAKKYQEILAESERAGEKLREEMRQQQEAEEAEAKAEFDDLMKDLGAE